MQERNENADPPRGIDRKPRTSTRYWLVGAMLAIAVLAAMLHPFSPGSLRDAPEPAAWAPSATSLGRDAAHQQVLSIESEALALTVERPAGGDTPPRPGNPDTRTHVVVRGDTLWEIAKKYVGDPFRYPELTALSDIRNPDLIYPGDIVRIEIRENRK
jgi:nucleoid-associated protein YgaU